MGEVRRPPRLLLDEEEWVDAEGEREDDVERNEEELEEGEERFLRVERYVSKA